MNERFELLGRVEKNGHRIFWDKKTSQYAIADNSGHTPDRTDDGILFIDTNRITERGLTLDREGSVTVPLLKETGDQVYTAVRPAGAARLLQILEISTLEDTLQKLAVIANQLKEITQQLMDQKGLNLAKNSNKEGITGKIVLSL
jgi:hypothetical protein